MNNEEILKAAREEKNRGSEFENRVRDRGAIFSAIGALFLCAVMFYVEYLILHKLDYGKPALIMFIVAISDMYEGIRLKSKKKIIVGVCSALLFVLCIVMYIGALVK